jgi:hypothetical protein
MSEQDGLVEHFVMVQDAMVAYKRRAKAAEAEVERLKGVLGIFAAIKADDGDTFDTWNDDVIIRCEVTVGDLKKARAALEVSR